MGDTFSDVFGHYLRTETTHYISAERNENGRIVRLDNYSDFKTIEEPCNPWLMFFHIRQKKWMKPNTEEWVYQDDEVEKLWVQLSQKHDQDSQKEGE